MIINATPAVIPHERLKLYTPDPVADALLCGWWTKLVALGELETTFGEGSRAIGQFFSLFTAHGADFLYALDDDGQIACGFLVTNLMRARFVTVWLSPAWRRHALGMEVLESAYDLAFERAPVVIGITRQERLLPIHEHWGYTVLGRLPAVFDGYDGWVVVLTAEAYDTAKASRRHRAA